MIKGKKFGSNKDEYIHIAGHMNVLEDKEPQTFTAVSYREGEVQLNITRVVGIDGTKINSLIEAEVKERINAFDIIKWPRQRIRGFEKSFILSTSPQVGIRELRNIIGEYVMTAQDVITCKDFDENIAGGCYPIDIHDHCGGKTMFTFLEGGGSYGIPYRALISKGTRNILTARRCISTTHESHGTVRIMATAMATGQAAGTAAIASNQKVDLRDADISYLKYVLDSQGAILYMHNRSQ